MIPLQRQSLSPQNYNHQPSHHQQQQPQQQQVQASHNQRESHPAMIISHQPFDGQGFYPQQQQQQQHPSVRLPNAPYHPHPMQKQAMSTIDPSLLAVNQFGSTPPVKQEDSGMEGLNDPFGNLGGEYELGSGLEVADPSVMMSPLSSSPLDDPEFGPRSSNFTPHGSGSLSTSLHSTPYGTPGVQMPHGNFYSMSMPVHATNGFGAMDQAKLLGSQPSSFSAYGQIPEMIDESSLKQLDQITEKRRRRRESHNAVERRRRDNINEKIQELATLLPDFASDSQNKPNKGVILRRSVEYIRQMQTFATLQVDRNREIEQVLRRVLEQTGINEADLGLSIPLGTPVEMPTVPPPGPGEQHVDHNVMEQGDYGDMGHDM
ncbi:hypothetical protein SpCBS45565_g08023 [Spizellomyces sp. 'palustris']|nr:hypothetical protein SpCBS45565_g08023 [Spizellomyces sp. 'palustris']